MTPRATTRNRSSLVESVAHQLHSWKPFHQHQHQRQPQPPDSKPYLFPTKKPCRSDRSTAPPPLPDPSLDLSRLSLSLRDDAHPPPAARPRDDPFFLQGISCPVPPSILQIANAIPHF